MKISLKGINYPTPRKVKRISNAILGGCTFIFGVAAFAQYKEFAITILAIGFIAKCVSCFYSEDDKC